MHHAANRPRTASAFASAATRSPFASRATPRGGALLAAEVTIPAGGGPPALHRHDAEELYRVERGELALYLDEGSGRVRRTLATPGAVSHIPGGQRAHDPQRVGRGRHRLRRVLPRLGDGGLSAGRGRARGRRARRPSRTSSRSPRATASRSHGRSDYAATRRQTISSVEADSERCRTSWRSSG